MAVPALLLLAATAGLASASLRLPRFSEFLLAAYLLASAELVALTLVLSGLQTVTGAGYVAAELLVAGPVFVAWRRRGRPIPRLPAINRRALRRHPLLVTLGAVVGTALLFQLFLVFVAPPNNWDSMTYHLSRAAAWYQHGALGYIPGANTERLNIFPPNGEIGALYTFALLGSDRLVALPQYVAGLALLVGCYAGARRLGFPRSSSMFATLMLGSFSQVALEQTTAQNDLIVASFIVVAAVFTLEGSRAGVALAGVAVGLAVGTKTTALFALPLLALIALAALRRSQRVELILYSAAGSLCLGSFGYIDNLIHRHSLLGAGTEQNAFRATLTPTGVVSRFGHILGRFFDLPGFSPLLGSLAGVGALLAVLVAAPPVLAALEQRHGHSPGAARVRTAALLVAFAPILVVVVGVFEKLAGIHVGVNLRANEDLAFFGPLGAVLLVPAAGLTLLACRRPGSDLRLAAIAASIPIFAFELAAVYQYNEWIGRFMIIPVALSGPLLAAVYRARRVAAAAVAVAGVTLFATVAFNERKPTGLAGTTPVWEMSRQEVETISRPRMAAVIRMVQSRVSSRARLGVVLGHDDWSYPFYGRSLERELVYLRPTSALTTARQAGIQDVLFARGKSEASTAPGWRMASIGHSGWKLARWVERPLDTVEAAAAAR